MANSSHQDYSKLLFISSNISFLTHSEPSKHDQYYYITDSKSSYLKPAQSTIIEWVYLFEALRLLVTLSLLFNLTAFNQVYNIHRLACSSMKKMGFIQLILGPMFSGKSSEMQRKVRRYQHARKNCLVVNYINDTRYSAQDVATTHDRLTIKALRASTLQQVKNQALHYDIVAIDEGQFFPDIAQEAENLANSGVIVIIAALDGTFQRKPFGNVLSLIPMAEYVTKLSAVCIECGKEAAFTRRTIDSQQIQVIGGEQAYKPVCRQCFGIVKKQEQSNNEESKAVQKILQNRSSQLDLLKV